MNKVVSIISLWTIFLVPAMVRGDPKSDLNDAVADLNEQARTAEGHQRVLASISRETGVPVSTLEAQRSRTRLGYGELMIANSLANSTGKSFDELAALKASGKGWGEIARDNNVNLGSVVSQAHRADREAQRANAKDGSGGKGHANGKNESSDKAGEGRNEGGSDKDGQGHGNDGEGNHGSGGGGNGGGHGRGR